MASNRTTQTDLFTIKATYNGETRRRTVDSQLGFEGLQTLLEDLFQGALVLPYLIQYTDADGDLITVTSDLELEETYLQACALQCANSSSSPFSKIVVRLQISDPQSSQVDTTETPSQKQQQPSSYLSPRALNSVLESLQQQNSLPNSEHSDLIAELVNETINETLETPPLPPASQEDPMVGLLEQMLKDPRFTGNTLPELLNNPEVVKMLPNLLHSPFVQQTLQSAFANPQLISASLPYLLENLNSFLPLLASSVMSPQTQENSNSISSSRTPIPESLD